MRFSLIRDSLCWSFLFVLAITYLAGPLAGTFFGYLGFLLIPGEWAVYSNFEVNNHDLLPFLMAWLVNVLVYGIVFAPLLGRRRRKKPASEGK